MLKQLFEALAPFEPTLVGTFPLGLLVSGSDIDIACSAERLSEFEAALNAWCRSHDVVPRTWERHDNAQCARFDVMGTPVEIYCAPTPVFEQAGFRHMTIEARLLTVGRSALRKRVHALKVAGMKTEPAFAQVLGLSGDPYAALLELESWSSEQLRTLLHDRISQFDGGGLTRGEGLARPR